MFILLYDTFVELLLLLLLAVPSSPKELTIRPESRPVRTHGPFVVNALIRCVAGAFHHMGLRATTRQNVALVELEVANGVFFEVGWVAGEG